MNYILKYISTFCCRPLVAVVWMLFVLASCIGEKTFAPDERDDRVTLELFTRMNEYALPETRAGSADSDVDTEPYIIVFKDNGSSSYIFEEVAKSYRVPGKNKTYVALKKQTALCKLLLFTNTQDNFYAKSGTAFTSYVFNEENLKTVLEGKTLEQSCDILYTEPLTNPQTDVPFTNPRKKLPLSLVYQPSTTGINDNTTIGTDTDKLQLGRAVAQIVVRNTAANFTLLAVSAVVNAPKRGVLHNLSATAPPAMVSGDGVVDYKKTTGDISGATSNTTGSNPVYLYESGTANNTSLVIKGTYQGKTYYYKMDLLDNNKSKINILRDYRYTFNITEVNDVGHGSVEEAIHAEAFNHIIKITLTIDDTDAYETTRFDNYYLSVSNSHYILYHATTAASSNLVALKLIVKNSGGEIVTGSLSATGGITVVPSSLSVEPGGVQATNVTITIPENLTLGTVTIRYGNIYKEVTVEKRTTAWSDGSTKAAKPSGDFNYYCVSGTATGAVDLLPSNGTARGDTRNITVDDGIILVKRTGTGVATFYLSTALNPGSGSAGEDVSRRIKVELK
ncbi:hypothetical protein [Butyricimonas sp. Marseille-P3923]|uniref:hypothetical protein n=1 Tax=Butyricimonas sp. Marseille-P3923 TaxID=1987504 RepID=UPI001145A5CA|nr:hypothetical protein [Butyricimonas sp. Marseille-P3923]